MKNKQWLFLVLASAMISLIAAAALAAGNYEVSNIALTPGETANELNFAWTTDDYGTGECAVHIFLKSTDNKKNHFRKKAAVFTGTKAAAEVDANDDGYPDYYYCEVTVTGLKNQTEYIYKLGDNDGNWSGRYEYSTENRNRYGFAFLSDAQIGSGVLADDIAGWENTVALINENFPEAAFILSAGDQIEHSGNEDEWAGFFSPEALTSIPVAPIPANHDQLWRGALSHAFDYHFNLPNETDLLTTEACTLDPPPPPGEPCPEDSVVEMELASGDYYFTYGKALFMVLNTDCKDYELHESFMQEAVDANPDVPWRIAVWHYTIYTAADRGPFVDRAQMATIVEDLNIDLVLMGHDHTYCRSYPLFGDAVQDEFFNKKGESVNPTGVVYFTSNSASGSKYYALSTFFTDRDNYTGEEDFHYVAQYSQEYVPTFSYITVDANSLEVTSYRTDNMEVFDTYKIKKTDPKENRARR